MKNLYEFFCKLIISEDNITTLGILFYKVETKHY